MWLLTAFVANLSSITFYFCRHSVNVDNVLFQYFVGVFADNSSPIAPGWRHRQSTVANIHRRNQQASHHMAGIVWINFHFRIVFFFNGTFDNVTQAGSNFHPSVPESFFRTLMGVHPDSKRFQQPAKLFSAVREDLPAEFDSRLQWPNCPTIREIRDQGSCGSCWAFGAVEAMSDRVSWPGCLEFPTLEVFIWINFLFVFVLFVQTCIHSNGTENVHISADDLVSCCHTCGFGCNG